MGDWWVVVMMVSLWIGALIYREVANDRYHRKQYNKRKKKKFHI